MNLETLRVRAGEFRRDSELFLECARDPEGQRRTGVAMSRGFRRMKVK